LGFSFLGVLKCWETLKQCKCYSCRNVKTTTRILAQPQWPFH
jgi:hypothetical protein